jgi:hypothetical protein
VRYYDAHLHFPTPDREGMDRFLRYVESERSLVGGNLILNTPAEVETYCRYRDEIPSRFVVIPYYRAPAELEFFSSSGWYKIHPRLRRIDGPRIPEVLEHINALEPPVRGLIVDCFPWGPELDYDISLPLVIAIATALPSSSVLAAHGGGYHSWAFRSHTVSLKNVVYDFSATLSYYIGSDVLRPLQNYLRFVPHRVLFGTDWPFTDPAEQLGEFLRLACEIGLAPTELEGVIMQNAARLWTSWEQGART